MSNLALAVKKLVPQSTVIIGLVVSHDAVRDTSIIEMPINQAVVDFTNNVSTGVRFEARGRAVGIGDYAFVRDGFVESQAPSGTVVEIEIGQVTDI